MWSEPHSYEQSLTVLVKVIIKFVLHHIDIPKHVTVKTNVTRANKHYLL